MMSRYRFIVSVLSVFALSGVMILSTNVMAQSKPKAKSKSAKVQKAPQKVAAQFDNAKKAAKNLAKHPKLKKEMNAYLKTLAQMKKTQAQVDKMVLALPKMKDKKLKEKTAEAAKLQQKVWDKMESIADADIEQAKDDYKEAKEQFKQAMKILVEHMERQYQAIQKIKS